MADESGKGFLGWLGRQVGHVRKAIRQDVSPSKKLYKSRKIEEIQLPDQPNVKLRRTVIDEVIKGNDE